jgi:opacity protein-like surface antigen
MKKLFTILALVFVGNSFAQTVVGQGNFVLDPYIGFPQTNSIRQAPDNSINYKLNGGLLSYGLRFEYMLADNFGIGADVNYVISGANYDYRDTNLVYNESTNNYDPVIGIYNYDYTAKKLRMMVRMNYHFVQNERVDAYAGFGAGYRTVSRSWSTTNSMDNENPFSLDQEKALIPIALRVAIGTRIYFTDNIGAMIELGAGGGALLQFGISAKF